MEQGKKLGFSEGQGFSRSYCIGGCVPLTPPGRLGRSEAREPALKACLGRVEGGVAGFQAGKRSSMTINCIGRPEARDPALKACLGRVEARVAGLQGGYRVVMGRMHGLGRGQGGEAALKACLGRR